MKTDKDILEKGKREYPNLTQEAIKFIDATPDENYPLRILHAYRENCNSRYETHGLSKEDARFWEIMNEFQEQRAKILDEAIGKLTR